MLKSMLSFLLILTIFNQSIFAINSQCRDKSPYCNPNDCTFRPGYGMIYCKKTCSNCSTDFCEDSKYINCSAERKKDCDEMLSDYCPKLCSKCAPKTFSKRTKTIPISQTFLEKSKIRMKPQKLAEKEEEEEDEKSIKNGSFISPPLPRYEKFDDTTFSNSNDFFESFVPEDLLPEPQRIWPEPEPQRIQAFNFPPSLISSDFYSPIYFKNIKESTPANQVLPLRHHNNFAARTAPAQSPQILFQHSRIPRQEATEIEDSWQFVEPFAAPEEVSSKAEIIEPTNMAKLVNLLGCKNKDETICQQITVETCLSRPGYYLKLCPVTCKNCNGLQCIDSIKINCDEVKSQGACKLSISKEYCPRTCEYCDAPEEISENISTCKDELETCEQLAESGACKQEFSKSALRLYCAKSCGYCKSPQFYYSDSPLMSKVISAKKYLKSRKNQ